MVTLSSALNRSIDYTCVWGALSRTCRYMSLHSARGSADQLNNVTAVGVNRPEFIATLSHQVLIVNN